MLLRTGLIALTALAALAACAPAGEKNAEAPEAAMASASRAPAISVSDAWIPLPPDGAATAAGFVSIANQGGADRLLSVTSAIAAAVEIHDTIETNGVKKMELAKTGFEAPADGVLTLAPAGKHIMFIGLTRKLSAGETVDLTLNFEKAGAVKTTFTVKDGGGSMHGDHADHADHKEHKH